jgi:hypothetical protein
LSDLLEGGNCTLCKRDVQDLTDMDDSQRSAFLQNCSGYTCVTYRVRLKPALAAAFVLASGAAPMAVGTAKADQVAEELGSDEIVIVTAGRIARPMDQSSIPLAPESAFDTDDLKPADGQEMKPTQPKDQFAKPVKPKS